MYTALFTLLYAPSYWLYAQGLWQSDEQRHAPIVALLVAYLLWQLRPQLQRLPQPLVASHVVSHVTSLLLVLAGCLCLLGKAIDFPLLVLASQIPMLAGLLLAYKGFAALRLAWFPVAFLLFMLPIPSIMLTSFTLPLKEQLSVLAVSFLHLLDYPVARSGVLMMIGSYQMLLEDACSGINSLYAMLALASWYAYQRKQAWLLVLALPIALLCNLLRILLLLILTYHFGDGVTQTLHAGLGLLMFVAAWWLLQLCSRKLSPVAPARCIDAHPLHSSELRLRYVAIVAVTLVFSCLLPYYQPAHAAPLVLTELFPSQVGGWQQVEQQNDLNTLQRIYQNPQGQQILLAVAWRAQQLGETRQIHRPEYCYQAQGFRIVSSHDGALAQVNLRQFTAQRTYQTEYVSYWLTIGEQATLPGYNRKLVQLQQWLNGHADGLLIRISSRQQPQLNEQFIQQLLQQLSLAQRKKLGITSLALPHKQERHHV